MSKVRIGISGAAGRMGKRLVALTMADAELRLAAALDNPTHPLVGQDAGVAAGEGESGVSITADLKVDVEGPNRFHQNRTVSWQMSIDGSNKMSSTCLSDNG